MSRVYIIFAAKWLLQYQLSVHDRQTIKVTVDLRCVFGGNNIALCVLMKIYINLYIIGELI